MQNLTINQLQKIKLILEQRLENFERWNFNQEGKYVHKITNLNRRLEKIYSEIKKRFEKIGCFNLLELNGIDEYKNLKFYHVEYNTEKLYNEIRLDAYAKFPYNIIDDLSELAHFIFRDKLWYISVDSKVLLFRQDKIRKSKLIEGLNKINEYLNNYYFNYHFIDGKYRQ